MVKQQLARSRRLPRVSIVGLGYVGLSTAVCFATKGLQVTGVDIDGRKLSAIGKGESPLHEAGLGPLLKRVVRRGDLTCTSDTKSAVLSTSVTFISVGTPSREDGSMDTTYVKQASEQIGVALKEKEAYHVVAVKSTVLPGTSRGIVLPALEKASGKRCGSDFGLAVNPEFLREGSVITDTMSPGAIVLGPFDRKAERTMTALYRRFYRRPPPKIITSPENAELVKYSANTFRGVQLSFLNTLANISYRTPGADVGEVIKGLSSVMMLDRRYQRPGLGFGGSCVPKDLRALVSYGEGRGGDARILQAALEVNERQPSELVGMAEEASGGLEGKAVSVLGLAFKANTDDVRESPAIALVKEMLKRGARVRVHDPVAMAKAKRELDAAVEYCETVTECVRGSDCCFIATDWKEFKLKPRVYKELMGKPVVLDGRRLYEPSEFKGSGVLYRRVGDSWRRL
jgi:UDPglucose 6-dehydrogenase